MEPRYRADLLWGAIGALSFLVLLQGYHLVGGTFVGVGPMAGVAAAVFVVSAVATHVLRPHLARWNKGA
ncbi:hypothetical protein BRC66_00940 [Halobacteriales archaeon QH_2_66_30]|jgi:hypothetical protein|nr:MAG: hypothetical protein BRC66_00940 [Halobacteriales archaeon QH_2_66_30]